MTVLLTNNLPLLADAPNGIKKLRELILELAVRGKLVPQDPSDEPASELLKRIAEEKSRLISEEGLRTTAREDISEAEHYFMLHTSWASCRLGNLARFIDYRGRTPTKTSSGVPLITAKNVRPGFISREPQEFIAGTDYLSWMTRGFPRAGDMLFTTEAPMGNVAIIDIAERFALAQRVICFQLHELGTGPFLKLAMMSSGFQAQLSDAATGMTATGIKSSRLKEIPVPIPPLPEQRRIVAKVDELMALCDRLEARQTDADSAHAQLVQALLDSLTQARDAEGFAQNWQRLAEHFHTLFTTESSIDALKQTLLQLAVMGKLVAQDPSDEPASELLKQPSNESANEVLAKKKKLLPASMKEQNLFVPPRSWVWCCVGDLISIKHGYAFSSDFFCNSRSPYVLTTPGNFFEYGGFKDRGDRTKYYDGPVDQEFILEPGDLIVAMTEQASGLLGSVAIIPSDEKIYLHNQRLGKLIFNREILCSGFVSLYFNSAFLRSSVAESSTGMKVKHTSPVKIEAIKFPLPPLAEQHRIVAKVDQLMALCDQLKARLTHARQVHEQLATALVEQAVA